MADDDERTATGWPTKASRTGPLSRQERRELYADYLRLFEPRQIRRGGKRPQPEARR